ncbi:MAG: endonuclease III [Pirellulaceae bacterium]|nr:endonuclease III [Pirellulaceae bacterium]
MARPTKRHVNKVLSRLQKHYPAAECALDYSTPEQLLIATILSAQCTDKRVNLVTAPLFKKYPTPFEIALLDITELEKLVKSTGFYRNKAKNIKACCVALVERHNGKVPQNLEDLVALAGVGRKTANVVLGTAFGIASGVVVDTHVGRISTRLGLTTKREAISAEKELMAILPREEWINYSHRLIHFGRGICQSRKPDCGHCFMESFCPKIGLKTSVKS